MDTQSFLSLIELHPGRALVFKYDKGKAVAPGYHVTEIMSAHYQSVDCGGQANAWRETVVQLQGPGAKDKPEYMSTDKFLSIYRRVTAAIPVRPEAELRLEYGDHETPAMHYHIGRIDLEDNAVVVQLVPPGVTCKAADRRAANERRTSPQQAAPIPLEVLPGGCCD